MILLRNTLAEVVTDCNNQSFIKRIIVILTDRNKDLLQLSGLIIREFNKGIL